MSETLQPEQPQQPTLTQTKTDAYRENYANSVHVKMSVWDISLVFGVMSQEKANEVELENFQTIFLSPQQAKALLYVLSQNVQQYEQTFGELKLEPSFAPAEGQIN
jgi:hypothetical protein